MIKDLKSEIDLQNIFFCITVLVIHLLSGPIAELNYGGFWHTVCFYIQRPMFFAVYGFIFLSGQKSFLSTKKEKVLHYYKKRFKTIVVPYIIAVLVTWMFFYRQDGILALFKFLLNGRAGAQFYFVIVIVQFYIIVPLLKVVMKRISPKIMLTAAFAINIIAVFLLSDTEYCELILHELCNIRIKDLNLKDLTVHIVGKGGRVSDRPILPTEINFIKELIKSKGPEEKVFNVPLNEKKTRSLIGSEIRRITKSLDLPVSSKCHEFRKYAAQTYYKYLIDFCGYSVKDAEEITVSKLLSHGENREDLKKIYLRS